MARRTRILIAVPALLGMVFVLLLLSFPRFVKMPWVVVKNESVASLVGLAGWVSYLHSYLAQLRWSDDSGLKDFQAAVAELKARRDPDLLELGKLEWHRGNFAAAVSHIEAHHRKEPASESSLFWLALSQLRLAEARNCLDPLTEAASRHAGHQRMCSLPLSVHHRERDFSRQAAGTFARLLEEHDPHNRLYQWLLNFSYMTVDGFPHQVPEKYRIDGNFIDYFYGERKRAMTEKYAYLKLRDRARELGVDTLDAGRGVAVEDFDGDGYFDIVTGGAFEPTRYYWNHQGQGFVDKSQESGIGAIKGTHLITAADYDDDGWMDLFVSHVFGSPLGAFVLLRNHGDGTFSDQTVAMGLLPPLEQRTENTLTWASAWGDMDNDGDLDLFVATWAFYNGSDGERHPNPFANNMDSRLYRNDGTRFVNVTAEYGLRPVVKGLNIFGAAFGDYDGDGFADLALTPQWIPGIVLLKNLGGRGFEETDLVPSRGWGFMTSFLDVNHDGLLDLFVGGSGSARGVTVQTVFGEDKEKYNSGSVIWLQTPEGTFVDHQDFFQGQMPIATMGSNFGDLDNDGSYDFYLGTGNPEGWFILPNLMYMGVQEENRARGEMDNVSMLNGVGTVQKGHGIVFFDYDNDGDQDLYSSLGGMWPGDAWPNQLFVNESEVRNTWTKIRLRGRRSNRFGVGARIKVVVQDRRGRTRNQHYYMDNKTGFGSAPYLAHLGLGDAVGIERVEVVWPGDGEPKVYSAHLEATNLLDENGTVSQK